MLSGLELSIPALFLVGLQTSPHCGLMCGGLQLSTAGKPHTWAQMQALRVLSYSLLGSGAGWLGGQLLWYLPQAEFPLLWRLGLGLSIVMLGLMIGFKRPALSRPCPKRSHKRPVAMAAAWGFMPCPMLYAALGVATFSAHPLNGGLLMLAFALGTLPMHSLQLLAYRWFAERQQRPWALSQRTRGSLIAISGSIMLLSTLWLPAESLLFCLP